MDAEIARDPEFSKHYEVLPTYGKTGNYKSSHFPDVDNYLAHARVSDRAGPNGEKILHVEEIQSDLHQEGRKKGYQLPEDERKALDNKRKEIESYGLNATPEQKQEWVGVMNRLQPDSQHYKVPDAPFKKNWHELTMKRILDDAVKGGYDKVVITPGAEQAKRYDLSKQVDSIVWRESGGGIKRSVNIVMPGDRQITISVDDVGKVMGGEFNGKTLDEIIGKDFANKIMDQPQGNLSGEGLKIGGEGMKGFYDEMLPSYLNKYGEKYGAKVGSYNIPDPDIKANYSSYIPTVDDINRIGMQRFGVDRSGMTLDQIVEAENIFKQKISDDLSVNLHSFDITPQMREEITTKGQSLYQAAPPVAIGAGLSQEEPAPEPAPTYRRGGAVSQDAMRMAVWDHPIKREVGGEAEPTIEEMQASLIPSTMNPNIAAQGKKGRANMAPPTSVMDPRSRDYERRSRETENFLIGADILAGALPFAPLAKGAVMAAGRYAGPELARGLENYMAKSGAVLPMDVWHGSPHRFPPTAKNPLGEFDPMKIGTGEGAQAYGAGAGYLAEAKGVAANYRNVLSDTLEVKGQAQPLEKRAAQMALTFGDNTTEGALKWLSKFEGKGANHTSPQMTPELVQQVKQKFSDGTFSHGGSLYKVDLPDEQIAKMLDWDKPLSQQPPSLGIPALKALEAQQQSILSQLVTLENAGKQMTPEGNRLRAQLDGIAQAVNRYHVGGRTGGDYYTRLTLEMGSKEKASEALRQAGIPGIRYLDQGSRAGGAGTSNFVVFDPAHMNIIGRE
jgi:hypothetical protein